MGNMARRQTDPTFEVIAKRRRGRTSPTGGLLRPWGGGGVGRQHRAPMGPGDRGLINIGKGQGEEGKVHHGSLPMPDDTPAAKSPASGTPPQVQLNKVCEASMASLFPVVALRRDGRLFAANSKDDGLLICDVGYGTVVRAIPRTVTYDLVFSKTADRSLQGASDPCRTMRRCGGGRMVGTFAGHKTPVPCAGAITGRSIPGFGQ